MDTSDAFGGAVRLVLVEPQDGRNVGSVGRLCANFGVSDVVIVSQGQVSRQRKRKHGDEEQSDTEMAEVGVQDEEITHLFGAAPCDAGATEPEEVPFSFSYWKHAKTLATKEGVVALQGVRVVDTFEPAVKDCTVVVAFIGREGGKLRPFRVDSRELGQLLLAVRQNSSGSTGRLALVFGREDCGLHLSEIQRCSHCCTLRTHGCGSLNLSHAVGVVLGRLFEDHQAQERLAAAPQANGDLASPVVANAGEVHRVLEGVKALLEKRGLPVGRSRKERREKLCFRILKHLAGLSRVLQQSQAAAGDLESVEKVAELLASGDPRLSEQKVGEDPANSTSFPLATGAAAEGTNSADTDVEERAKSSVRRPPF